MSLFTYLKKKFTKTPVKPLLPAVRPDSGFSEPSQLMREERFTKMTLAERKAWRLEMLHKSVRRTMMICGAFTDSYKFKVNTLDNRGHIFDVLMEVTSKFEVNDPINSYAEIEKLIMKHAFAQYGLAVKSVYWKTNEDETVFERKKTGQPPAVYANTEDGHLDFVNTMPFEDPRDTTRPKFAPVSADEEAAFKAALVAGVKPPPVHVGTKQGTKEYLSDIMPFGER